jgi:hypothetical protein
MAVVRWQPDGMDGGHDPDAVFHGHRDQAAQRAKQLAARVLVGFGGQLLVLPASGREDDRAGIVIQVRL